VPDAGKVPAVSLKAIDITFNLNGGLKYRAVKNISLDVGPGEFVSIVGPTGCGKSTLLNAAAGLLRPAAGAVGIFGKPLAGLNLKVGYLFQQDALMLWNSALENVAVALEPKGMSAEEARTLAGNGLAASG
jgi:NitT/TauT family transport system ATP-binding protein